MVQPEGHFYLWSVQRLNVAGGGVHGGAFYSHPHEDIEDQSMHSEVCLMDSDVRLCLQPSGCYSLLLV